MRALPDFRPRAPRPSSETCWPCSAAGRNELLAYDAVRENSTSAAPSIEGSTRGARPVIGSVNRYRDFDRAFLPTQGHTADRWQRVSRAWYDNVSLPPVLLYKVGDIYFVVDGNHRVSVARDQGQEYIDAEVRECQVKVPVTLDLQPDDLEFLGAKVEFLERSEIDRLRPQADISATILGGYERMLEHMRRHRYSWASISSAMCPRRAVQHCTTRLSARDAGDATSGIMAAFQSDRSRPLPVGDGTTSTIGLAGKADLVELGGRPRNLYSSISPARPGARSQFARLTAQGSETIP